MQIRVPTYLIFVLALISGCSSLEKKSLNREIASTTEILLKDRSGSKLISPYYYLSGRVTQFHADENSANGICKHFKFSHAISFEAVSTDANVTWLGEDGTFSVVDQMGGFYAIASILCQ